MKHILSLLVTMFLFGCATSQVEAQSGKTKVQSKIASYEAEKTLLMISNGLTESQKEFN